MAVMTWRPMVVRGVEESVNSVLFKTDSCGEILGLTGYSREDNIRDIEAIERDQLKEAEREQSTPTKGETKLVALIDYFHEKLQKAKTDEAQIQLSQKIERKQRKLEELWQRKALMPQDPLILPDSEEKQQYRAEIEEKERAILNRVGCLTLIRLKDLENPNQLATCMNILDDLEPVNIESPAPPR